jgi:hypothetical protein
VILHSPHGVGIGDNFDWFVSNMERRVRDDEPAGSDMAFLLAALNLIPNSRNQHAWVKAIIKAGGRAFMGDITYEAFCDPTRPIWRTEEGAERGGPVEGTQGCGQRYRLRMGTKPDRKTGKVTMAIPRDMETGAYYTRFLCVCEAEIFSRARIQNIQKAPAEFDTQPAGGNGEAQATTQAQATAPTPTAPVPASQPAPQVPVQQGAKVPSRAPLPKPAKA